MSDYNLRPRKRPVPVAPNCETGAKVTKSEAQIFEKLSCKERLKVEQVSKKWQYVGKNFSWTNYKIFDNNIYINRQEECETKIEAFFDRCGRHLRHLIFHRWSPEMVLSLIRRAPNVQHLYFCGVKLNDEFLKKLSLIVPDLKSLHFKGSLVQDERNIYYGLIDCFKVMTCLEYLYISNVGIVLESHSFIQFPPNLKYFSLNFIENKNKILNWVAKGCKGLKGLQVARGHMHENSFEAISQMKRQLDNKLFYVVAAIARYCKKLEQLTLIMHQISSESHTSLLRLATLPNLCSLVIEAKIYPKEQTIELVNRLIANNKIQFIKLIISASLDPEILFALLRHCKTIRFIGISFHQIDHSDLCSKICQVVDEIEERDRQQCELTGVTHPIVEVQLNLENNENLLPQYKWLRFTNYVHYRPRDVEKWQYGWLSAGKPLILDTKCNPSKKTDI